MNNDKNIYDPSIRISKTKAIRLKCLDCCAYQQNEVKLCASTNCPLWRYRMGHEEKDDLYKQYQEQKKNNPNKFKWTLTKEKD